MAAWLSSPQPSPLRRARQTTRFALALLAALLAGGLTTAPVQAVDDEHLALDGSYALPSAPARFSRDWSAGPGFGIAWVVPASSTRDWALRLGGNSFGYAPRSYVDSKVSLVSLTWAYRAILRENALSPYVRVAAGPALVGWQEVTTGYDRDWGSQGTSGWAGCVEVGGGISPPIPGASVRPFVDVSWVAAFTGERLGQMPLHAVTTRLGFEFVPPGLEEESTREAEAKAATEVEPAATAAAAAPASSDSNATAVMAPGWRPRDPATQRTRLFVGAGLSFPAGTRDAPDYWGAGRGLEVGGEFRIVERAAFVVTCATDEFGFGEDRYREANPFPPGSLGHVSGESARITVIQAGVRVRPFSRGGWDAYADALLGRAVFVTKYHSAYDGPGGWGVDFANTAESGFAWAVGLGARRAPPGRLGWFAEAHWVSLQVFDGTWNCAPLRVGIIWR